MNDYLVKWEIDIYAETPIAAAMQALATQRNAESSALVFSVIDGNDVTTCIDLASDGDLTPAELQEKYVTNHPRHTHRAWREDVMMENTLRGYWDWVAAQIEETT